VAFSQLVSHWTADNVLKIIRAQPTTKPTPAAPGSKEPPLRGPAIEETTENRRYHSRGRKGVQFLQNTPGPKHPIPR